MSAAKDFLSTLTHVASASLMSFVECSEGKPVQPASAFAI